MSNKHSKPRYEPAKSETLPAESPAGNAIEELEDYVNEI